MVRRAPLAWALLASTAAAQQPRLAELTQLERLAQRLPSTTAAERLDKLAVRARATKEDAPLERRVFAVRCLGLLARQGKARPEDLAHLTRALADDARPVRWTAVRAIEGAQLTSKEVVRAARKALLKAWKSSPEDTALRAAAERVRAELLAQLRPAAPGGGPVDGEKKKLENAKRAARELSGMLFRARHNANESAAIATLRNLCSAQAQLQATGLIDVDGDGKGEYGYFKELSGTVNVRGDEKGETAGVRLRPPVMSGAFGRVRSGVVIRSGYCFRIFLPGKGCRPIPEAKAGGWVGCAIVADNAEVVWCAYAWPVAAGQSGRRAFFVDQAGDVLACSNAFGDYSDPDNGPGPGAARAAKSDSDAQLNAPQAIDALGRDGHVWRPRN